MKTQHLLGAVGHGWQRSTGAEGAKVGGECPRMLAAGGDPAQPRTGAPVRPASVGFDPAVSLATSGLSEDFRRRCRRVVAGWVLACLLGAMGTLGQAQSGPSFVRAHYAHGQVWVVWTVQDAVVNGCVPNLTPALSNGVPVVVSNCVPGTYAIYWSPNPVTNTATAERVGRLFRPEWEGAILKDNVRESFGELLTGFRIPDGAGGYRRLTAGEGLFVQTVRSNFAGHYAVRPYGEDTVPPEWRATLTNAYSRPADPPTCHLQARGTNSGYPIEWWTHWADGDSSLEQGRADYPVMENGARRGLPHNFSVAAPRGSGREAGTILPACVALHSGDGQAKMWLPGKNGFESIGLSPVGQLLIAVEDRFFSLRNGVVDAESVASTGYVPSFDPFFNHQIGGGWSSPADRLPGTNEWIVPYTWRRLNWTLDWLYAHQGVDSNRVALVGHSGGAKGSLLWSHASPERFASVGLYNPALNQFPAADARLIGTRDQNLPLLLTNRAGRLVRSREIHDLTASYSPLRDLPFTRVFHGKREENWVLDENQDGLADVGAAYRRADELGLGMALFWDLRKHGLDTWTYATLSNDIAHPNRCGTNPTIDVSGGWSIADLWVPTLAAQYRRDDATNQVRHRADRSYPAFFHCARLGGHGNPGQVVYTNNTGPYLDAAPYDGLVTTTECLPPSTGAARGTWGGYADWEPGIVDTPTHWSAVLFLVGSGSAFSPVEVCPETALRFDVAIRRPQQFRPEAGTPIVWRLDIVGTEVPLANGTTVVGEDDLVTIPDVVVGRDPGRVRLTVARADTGSPCLSPRLEIEAVGGVVEFTWEACAGARYRIESSPDLHTWSALSPTLSAPVGGGTMTWSTGRPVEPQFYRLGLR